MLLPRRSNARLVRMLMVPAGESASTSALVVLDISIESMPANDNPSKLTARELPAPPLAFAPGRLRSEEHTSELQSLMRISYAVFCLKNKTTYQTRLHNTSTPTT